VGGVTSDVRFVEVEEGRAVLKRVTNETWLAERPDVVAYEAAVLRWLAASPVPVPTVLAVDGSGAETGSPSLVLTFIDGVPAGETASPGEWMGSLVDTAEAIASLDPPAWVRPFRRYLEASEAVPPEWAADDGVWRDAIDIVRGPAPSVRRGFIHRDYHPWNVLWNGGLVGVVDWSQASVGPLSMDVSHCRANLAIRFGEAVADDFKSRWESATGVTHAPYWDLVTCIDFLPDWRPSARGNERLEAWVRHLLDELGV
jgi:aminoglycoside phosphotransferase (APT) family kinase protein